MPLAPGGSFQLGQHHIVREGPITRVTPYGEITYEHTEWLLAEYQGMVDEQGFVLIMMDMSRGGEMAMAARRLSSQWGSSHGDCTRSAVYGASFFLRSAIELINRAARLTSGKAPTLSFVRTHEEARDWLLAQIPTLPRKTIDKWVVDAREGVH